MGIFEQHGDIGDCNFEGNLEYRPDNQVYYMEGSGENMWFEKDQFHFAWTRLSGDFIIRARVEFIGQGVQEHRKTGLMIRSSLGTDATHVNGVVHGDGLTSIQFRKERGGMTGEHTSRARAPEILQLERRGSQYILSTAQVGEPFYTIVVADLDNNDHVISFDGKKLGISHHAEEEDGRSIIYTIPFEGGVPERITSLGPSYLHGWSPDGEYLTYTAGRNGNYDICKISVNKKEEIRLTDAPGLDDGSEYSPDGKRIACISNSNLK